jgi:hypothetical protein
MCENSFDEALSYWKSVRVLVFFGWPKEAVLGPEFGWLAREELTGGRLTWIRAMRHFFLSFWKVCAEERAQ